MLKLYDQNKNPLGYIMKYGDDLCIESDLSNGDKSLSFTYLAKNPKDIKNEYYIETKDDRYVVKEVGVSSDGFPEFKCQLDLEDLEADMFENFSAMNCTLEDAANLALAGTGWTVNTEITKLRSVATMKATPLTILGKIRDAWMCEIQYDNKNKIVYFKNKLGEDKGVYFTRSLNLRKVELTSDSYDYYTRIIPIGADGLRITDVNGGKKYVENYQYSNKVRTLIWEDSSYEDAMALLEDAEKKLEDLSKPKKSYSADVVDLAKQNPNHSILSYSLGDTVLLLDERTGIKDKQRIVRLTEYPRKPENNSCELSNITLTFEEQQERLQAAADAVENITRADGTVNGVYVHGVEADGIVGIEVTINNSEAVSNINNQVSGIQTKIDVINGELAIAAAKIGTLETTALTATTADLRYATIDRADILEGYVHNLEVDYGNFKTLTADEFAAKTAEIEKLSGDFASFKVGEFEILKSQQAEFEVVTANKFTAQTAEIQKVSGELASFKTGEFEELRSKQADFEEATANNFTATNGQIEHLSGEFASYKTTMSQELIVAKGWMLEGSIGNAQISSIDATKIKSGIIDTYLLTVKGSGGKLQIVDNTMQISDANRVRVQVGRDASGDYTLAVWDSSGKLIWDALGATENTIQRKIIKDKMIADDAAIQALKIDFQSFETALTNQGVTISGTVVQVGNKILNIELSEQRNLITDQGELISDHSSKIEANETAIGLRVTSQEYETYKSYLSGQLTEFGSRMTSAESSITTLQGQISLKVEQIDIEQAVGVVDSKFANYSTTTQMNTAINTAKNSAISTAASDASTKANKAKDDAISTAAADATAKVNAVDAKFVNYSTTTQMQAAIDISKKSILTSVSQEYTTKTELASVNTAANQALESANLKNKTYEGEGSPNYTGAGNIAALFTNKVPTSISENGSLFNGTGYQNDMRVRSSGALTGNDGSVATGFILVKAGDVIRFTSTGWSAHGASNCINFGYISSSAFTSIGSYTTQPAKYGIYQDSSKVNSDNIPLEESPGVWKVTVPNNASITYLRMSCNGTGANLIVTVNEEIKYGEQGAMGNPNSPSVTWKTTGTEADHVGDLYLDTETNHLYRWGLYDGEYKWKRINDDEISKVLSLESWKSEASILLTKDGIVQTVGNYYATSTDLNNATGRITAAESKIEQHAKSISLRVEKAGIISAINQTAESITIDAGKINLTASDIVNIIGGSTVKIAAKNIDLSGYVTMSDLSTAGSTTINGANITTGTISADRIDVSSLFSKEIWASGSINMGVKNDSYLTLYNGAAVVTSKATYVDKTFNRINKLDFSGFSAIYEQVGAPSNTIVACVEPTAIWMNKAIDGTTINIFRVSTNATDSGAGFITTNGTFTHTGSLTVSGAITALTFQAGSSTTNGGIELYHSTPFIDFHFGRDTSDFTARLIEEEKGILRLVGAFRVSQVIYMGPSDGGYERQLRFIASTGTNPHNAMLYGGNPNSATAIGCYDNKNSRGVWAYNDVDNVLNVTPSINTGSHDGSYIYCLKGGAALNVHTAGGSANFNALARIRAKAGAWMLGVLNSSSAFQLIYGNETIVNGSTNSTTCTFSFNTSGEFGANKIRVLNSGTTESNVIVSNGGITGNLAASGASRLGIYNNTASKWVIYAETTNMIYIGDRVVVPYTGTGGIRANATDASYDCGHTSYLWGTVYAKNGVKTTSDEREKDILNFDLSEMSDYFMSLEPIAFRWAYGNERKIHLGVGAQTTERKMIEAGYDPSLFDMIQHDDLEVVSDSGLRDRYGINYQDLNILTMMQTQKNGKDIIDLKEWKLTTDIELAVFNQRQDIQEARISELEQKIINLELENERLKAALAS